MSSSRMFIVKSISGQFDNPKHSDLVFHVEGKSIYAHRQYLSMISEHLAVMLSKQWTDPSQSEVTITDYDYETFYTYLKFLYSGEVAITEQNLKNLYSLSHRYFEIALQDQCEAFIKKNLSVESYYTLVRQFGSNDIRQCYQKWVMDCDFYYNYNLVAQIATDYELYEVLEQIEEYYIAFLGEYDYNPWNHSCHNEPEDTFRNYYEWGLKYRMKCVIECLASFLIEHYEQNCPCETSIAWDGLMWYYDVAIRYESKHLTSIVLGLFKESFAKRPNEWYAKVLNEPMCGDEFRRLIEEKLLAPDSKATKSLTLDTTIDLCRMAFDWGRLSKSVTLKCHLEQLLLRPFKDEDLFGPRGKFALLLQVSRQYEMEELSRSLTAHFNTRIVSMLDGIDSDVARELLHGVLEGFLH